ncbi:MAG: helix-turn-helix transcriptional regulator [Tyzzerella sp.]|nr:helix-turn-helix transcriptional regulator [Tyzzerella sp.]
MNMTDDFTNIRLQTKKYQKKISSSPFHQYLHKEGWIDTTVSNELIFSHRNTWYTQKTFAEKFHTHEYYELIFYIKGNIEYLNENTLISPSPYMVTWFKPGQMHTGRLLAPSQYERYVLYFSPDFFNIDDRITPLIDFMTGSTGTHMTLSEKKFGELLEIFKKIDKVVKTDKPYGELVLKSLLIEIFYILDSQETKVQEGEALTEAMGEIKRYIDANYASITAISDIADHFFYSREHLSRKFVQSFNITIANYLSRRRITESLSLLESMSVADVAYAVGFHTQSAFINAFKKTMKCLPSEYKLKKKQDKG